MTTRPAGLIGRRLWIATALTASMITAPAHASLVLSDVIVDLGPNQPPRQDIEAWNNGSERIYVVAQPTEIISAGTPGERRVDVADPAVGGLLVTPQRMILEPGERRLVRVALLAAPPPQDRVYRVTIKPVVGDVAASGTAIKVLVGYDVLVIARPAVPRVAVSGARDGRSLSLFNAGNTSVEIYGGRQCDVQRQHCANLPATRLYAGARWVQVMPGDGPVSYRIKMGNSETVQEF